MTSENSHQPPRVPRFLAEDPDHWYVRAKQMRATAEAMEDETIKATMLRIPPPWSVEQQDACFVVRDHKGQQLAYVNFEDEPGPAIYRNSGRRV